MILATLSVVLAVVIIAFVWYNLRKSAFHVNELKKKNNLIIQQNDELDKALISLQQSKEEVSKITRMVAHDLKNPISGIRILVASMLKKDASGQHKEFLEHISQACTNSLQVINDVLTKPQDTKSLRQKTDIKKLLESCVALLQNMADEKKQQIILSTEEVVAEVNQQQIWRVISNLITNAIKFSMHKSSIFVRLQQNEKSFLLSVKDNGIGIPDDLKAILFTQHPKSSRKGTGGEESYGLGLSISQKIVEELDGKIWFESIKGRGSTFYMELPSIPKHS